MQLKDNYVKRDLYLFWGMHPSVKVSKPVINYVLDCNKKELDSQLNAMVAAGLLEEHVQNGMTLYSLTTNEERRQTILEFVRHGHNYYQ